MPTAVIDCADWHLAQPLQPSPGTTLDFSGTRVRIAFAETVGGPAVASADTENGTLAFVPASGGALPYFAITLPVAGRSWRVSAPKRVFGDLRREPDPLNPATIEWLGRIELEIHPGSDSSGIAAKALRPVLLPVQPYGGALALGALQIGPQGAPSPASGLPPLPVDAATRDYTLGLIGGALAWVPTGEATETPGLLAFTSPTASSLLAAFPFGLPAGTA